MRSRLGRVTALAVTTALASTGALVAATPAYAAPDPTAARDGAAWLASQLNADGLLPGQFGGGDVGLTIDAGMSLDVVGGQAAAVNRITTAVSGAAGQNYIEYAYSFEGVDYVGQAANATGKLLAYQEALQVPTKAGTVDTLERMEALTTDTGDSAGRIVDFSTADGTPDGQDYANSLGQAFAARGLTEAGSDEAAAAVDYLLYQQCPGGGFRLGMAPATATSGLTCTDDGLATNDITGIVLQQLLELDSSDADVTQAIADGQAWLLSRQEADGSWGGSGAETASNANSTGLGALAVGPDDAAAAASAAAWLRTLQATATDACGPLAQEIGAIAYNADALAEGRTQGIDAAMRDQWQRVTAQVLPAMTYLERDPAAVAPTLGPTRNGYLRAGSQVAMTAGSLVAGDRYCLTGPGTRQGGQATAATQALTLTLPAGTANRAYRLVTDGGAATQTLKVLGAKKLSVKAGKARVKRGKPVTVTVRGLAAREAVTVRYKGAVVKRGIATNAGVFTARFSVGRATGAKAVVAQGQFADLRSGKTTVRVVR